jgi:hypothetical protein
MLLTIIAALIVISVALYVSMNKKKPEVEQVEPIEELELEPEPVKPVYEVAETPVNPNVISELQQELESEKPKVVKTKKPTKKKTSAKKPTVKQTKNGK